MKKGQPQTPSIYDLLVKLRADIFRNLNCVKIGKVIAFDGTKKTADVQILFKKVNPKTGRIRSYTILKTCPLFTLQGGGGAFQAPIAAGDSCLVLFSDSNIETWFKTGSESAPSDARSHALSDGIALVGLNWSGATLENYATDELKMTYGGAKVSLKGGKVIVKNGTTDLLTALIGFIDILKTLAVTDETGTWPINAASIAALETYKPTFQGLLST